MLSTLRNAWKIPDLRKKMLFTLFMLFVFRLGAAIPVPGMDKAKIAEFFASYEDGFLGMFNTLAGGTLKSFSIFALSITPYITASIIMQLLTIAIPSLEALAKEGDEGRKKIAQYTRFATVILALIQAIALSLGLFSGALKNDNIITKIVVVITLTAGTAFLMWIGEQITENGIGNGISLIIFTGIISALPGSLIQTYTLFTLGQVNIFQILLFLIISIAIIMGVVAIQEGSRKIPVQYAKRVVGRKMYGGQSSHIPLKVLMAGVIPVIFASALLQFLPTIALFWQGSGFEKFVTKYFTMGGNPGVWIYSIFNVILIIFFTYFYTAIQFNPVEYANNLKQYGGFIPGIRPGRPTSEYLSKVLGRITLIGAFALAFIATLPTLTSNLSGLQIRFGGTAVLIAVGVALETTKQIESQMQMRHYKGFLK